MNAEQFADLLEHLGACTEARNWAAGKTFREAWDQCHNCHWLLWTACHAYGDPFPLRDFYRTMNAAGFTWDKATPSVRADYVRRQLSFTDIEAKLLALECE